MPPSTSGEFLFFSFFLLIRPTDPISGNAFDSKRKKKGDGLIDFGILGVHKYTTTLLGLAGSLLPRPPSDTPREGGMGQERAYNRFNASAG